MKAQTPLIALVLLIVSELSAPAFAQGDTLQPKVVVMGVAGKLDPKAKSITVVRAISLNIDQLPEDSPGRASTRGRSGGNPGGGGGRGGGRGGANAGGRQASAQSRTEYKVLISSKTVVKEGDKVIQWTDIRIGDQLEVTSAKEGAKIDAIEVIRVPKDDATHSGARAPTPGEI